jgi:hypothetical protein
VREFLKADFSVAKQLRFNPVYELAQRLRAELRVMIDHVKLESQSRQYFEQKRLCEGFTSASMSGAARIIDKLV